MKLPNICSPNSLRRTILASTLLGCAFSAQAQFTLLDDFESLNTGSINNQGDWSAFNSAETGVVDLSGNQVFSASSLGTSFNKGYYNDSSLIDIPRNGSTGTMFFRYQAASANNNVQFGFADQTPSGSADFNAFEAYGAVIGNDIRVRDGSNGFVTVGTATQGEWLNFWFVVTNPVGGTGSIDVYMTTGDAGATGADLIADDFGFRNISTSGALDHFMFIVNGGQVSTQTNYFDDFYFDGSGVNLINPVAVIPEPSTLAMSSVLLAGFAFMVVRRRKNRLN